MRRLAWWILVLPLIFVPARPAHAQPADPAAPEEARERRAMERFLSLLEKNPRRGTALDRVYGYHVERGTLDELIKSYRDRLAKDGKDGTAAMILGLLEFQRGQDAAAVAALRQAEAARPDDPLPSYYLGQALVLVGQPEQAAEAFERALAAQAVAERPAGDLPGAGAGLSAHAEVRPGAGGLVAAGGAVPRRPPRAGADRHGAGRGGPAGPGPAAVRGSGRKVRDPFRQVQLAMQAAELKVRLGRTRRGAPRLRVDAGQAPPR